MKYLCEKKKNERKILTMQDLRDRTRKYHEVEGVSYKVLAQSIGISVGVMYNFTSGIRDLKEHVANKLDEYLKLKGY